MESSEEYMINEAALTTSIGGFCASGETWIISDAGRERT